MDTYENFQKNTYKRAVDQWNKSPLKLSYIIDRQLVNKFIEENPNITLQKIISDFAKYPLIKEVFMSNKNVILLPK